MSDGRYTAVFQESYRDGATIVDEVSGRATVLSPMAGCELAEVIAPLGGWWTLTGCGAFDTHGAFSYRSYELYDIRTGSWRALTPNIAALEAGNPGCPRNAPTACSVRPIAIGSQWIEFAVSWVADPAAPPPAYAAQNIWSGQVRDIPYRWLNGGRTVIDLNSGALAQRLCSPVTLPPGRDSLLPGTATIEGSFVISTGLVNTGAGPGNMAQSRPVFIQRCGSRKRIQIDPEGGPVAASARAVMWNPTAGGSQLTGLLLPSLRRFTLSAPSRSTFPVLASRHLYVDDENEHVWRSTTAFPPERRQLRG